MIQRAQLPWQPVDGALSPLQKWHASVCGRSCLRSSLLDQMSANQEGCVCGSLSGSYAACLPYR